MIMFARRFPLGFNVMDTNTITHGIAMNTDAPNNDTCVTGKGPILPAILCAIYTPGLFHLFNPPAQIQSQAQDEGS